MAQLRAPSADADLDDIWDFIATESGNLETADRFVESLTKRFYLLASNPTFDAAGMIYRPDCVASPYRSRSSSNEAEASSAN